MSNGDLLKRYEALFGKIASKRELTTNQYAEAFRQAAKIKGLFRLITNKDLEDIRSNDQSAAPKTAVDQLVAVENMITDPSLIPNDF